MLQNKQEVPFIGVFKLSSGEEFIGKVIEETVVSYIVSKPRCLVQAQQGLSFAPLMMLGDPSANVSVPKPVIHTRPMEALSTQYESSISGISIPQKSAILT